MKKEGRLSLRHEEELLEQVRGIARERGVTVTFLVDQFFRELVSENKRPKTDEELGVDQA